MAWAMPVYCPSCEAGVDAVSKFCLQCGHDLETDGPITSTGHDVRQLKELIRGRDDLSMADKFDLIAKVEEGENPIELGLAAPAEGSGVTPEQMEAIKDGNKAKLIAHAEKDTGSKEKA